MKNNSQIFTFLSSSGNYFYFISEKYFCCAEKLFKENKPEESLLPFCLLTVTACENFLKIIIVSDMCKNLNGLEKDDSDIKTTVMEEIRSYGHNIKKLIEKSLIKDRFEISELEEFSNGFVSDYRFVSKGRKIFLKNSESIRFGSLAKKQDLSQSGKIYFCPETIEFLKELKELSSSKLKNTLDIIRSSQ